MATNNLAQQITEYIAITRKRKLDETSNSPEYKEPKAAIPPTAKKVPTRLYSKSLADCVRTFCCECDQQVKLSVLRKHVVWHHKQLSILQYKEHYGEPQKQIIKMIHHTCALCKKDIVHDYDAVLKHLKRVHKTNMALYVREYMDKDKEITSGLASSNPVKPTTSTHDQSKNLMRSDLLIKDGSKENSMEKSVADVPPKSPSSDISLPTSPVLAKSPSLPSVSLLSSSLRVGAPSCNPCSKVFRSNMEFKMHNRRTYHKGIQQSGPAPAPKVAKMSGKMSCNYCEKAFRDNWLLNRHTLRVHKKD